VVRKADLHPQSEAIREIILWEAPDSAYSIHLGSTKMYKDLKKQILVVRHEARYCRVHIIV
jgi:hypothetical protein